MRPGPADRLHPGRQAALARRESGPPICQIDVEDRHEVQRSGPQVPDVVRPADQDLVRTGQASGLVVAEPPDRYGGSPACPPLHVLRTTAPDPERRPATGPAAPRGTADDAGDPPGGGAEEPAARRAGRWLPTRPADLGDPGTGQRREHESAARGRERL